MSSPLKTNTETIQNLINQINALPDASSGVELPELTNEGSAADLLSGKELIDQEGNIVTGTIETKTSSNLTASGATVTVPAGYYASNATKSVTTATQATPSISVDSAGKITASATQTAGYVSAGTKSGTKQLTTQAAKTITPSTSSQTAVASGVYTTGTVTIAGDSNLKAENIAEGVSIFGVTGSHSGGSGGASNISVEFEYELTEEMYEPGANLYTFIPKTDFNINDCATFRIELIFTHYTNMGSKEENCLVDFVRFSTLDNIILSNVNSSTSNNTVTGSWVIDNNNITLIGTLYISTEYTLEIVGTGILI